MDNTQGRQSLYARMSLLMSICTYLQELQEVVADSLMNRGKLAINLD